MRIGTDIIEIERIRQAYERFPRLAKRILSPNEFQRFIAFPPKRQITFLAGRFSAKEAYSKAVGTGIGNKLKFSDISIEPDEFGAPLVVSGPVTTQAKVSISHAQAYATATVLIELSDKEIALALDNHFKEAICDD